MFCQMCVCVFFYWLGCNFSSAFEMSPSTLSNKRVNQPPPLLKPIDVIVTMASLIFGSENDDRQSNENEERKPTKRTNDILWLVQLLTRMMNDWHLWWCL